MLIIGLYGVEGANYEVQVYLSSAILWPRSNCICNHESSCMVQYIFTVDAIQAGFWNFADKIGCNSKATVTVIKLNQHQPWLGVVASPCIFRD